MYTYAVSQSESVTERTPGGLEVCGRRTVLTGRRRWREPERAGAPQPSQRRRRRAAVSPRGEASAWVQQETRCGSAAHRCSRAPVSCPGFRRDRDPHQDVRERQCGPVLGEPTRPPRRRRYGYAAVQPRHGRRLTGAVVAAARRKLAAGGMRRYGSRFAALLVWALVWALAFVSPPIEARGNRKQRQLIRDERRVNPQAQQRTSPPVVDVCTTSVESPKG